jgi:hypothetical protein
MNIEWLSEEQEFAPEKKGFAGMFFVGFRKNPQQPSATQRVGTVILKRSYSIDTSPGDTSSGVLTPFDKSDEPVPIYFTDRQGNLVQNSDFDITIYDHYQPNGSKDKADFWIEENDIQATLVSVNVNMHTDFANKNQKYIVRLAGSNPQGRLTLHQPISFKPNEEGLFQFSLYVCADKDDAQIEVEKIRVEAAEQEEDSAQHLICEIGGSVGSTFVRRVAENVRFPAELAGKKVQITISLPIATDSKGDTVKTYYNMVQLEERGNVSEWDPDYVLRCESDLVPYKPKSDIIVSGFTQVGGDCEVQVNGQPLLRRVCRVGEKSLFGWEPRVNVNEDRRHEHLGDFSQKPEDYLPKEDFPPEIEWPARDPLPSDFENEYFNGYLRELVAGADMPRYLSSDARISILRNNSLNYEFFLAGERYDAAYYVLEPGARDSEAHWQRHALTMNLDTLVIEPDNDTCYAVWRGVWDFDRHADGDYRKLEIVLL